MLASDQSARLAELLADADILAAPVNRRAGAPPGGWPRAHRPQPQRRLRGRPRRPRHRHRPGAVRVGAGAPAAGPAAGRAQGPAGAPRARATIVVHVDHGIARYAGLVRRAAGGDGSEERDFLELHFAGAGRIWVPVEQIDRVTRYAGGEEPQPSAPRAAGSGSAPGRASARRSATWPRSCWSSTPRAPTPEGRAFGEDTPWQTEMEAAFPYEETPDQLRAALEVKADLERDTPMDRLVVGDVGYGKTEVALRAAFKAIQDGKQVAVLVPTTVLAAAAPPDLQPALRGLPGHGADAVAVRARARSSRRRWQGLAAGGVDIVIGTHRLLQQGRALPGPGPGHRGRGAALRRRRTRSASSSSRRRSHVLTLSATPIPRTLNLALVGVRDMSVIETPPEDRLPIQTRVAEASRGPRAGRHPARAGPRRPGLLRPQPRRDHRGPGRAAAPAPAGGPHRRGHGQMAEGAPGDGDARLRARASTTSWCAPRSSSRAWTSPTPTPSSSTAPTPWAWPSSTSCAAASAAPRGAPTPTCCTADASGSADIARKRLQAIFNASELGAGFQIALADLEIRGAGNILGAEQHGHMAAVGFDLYTRMLAEAVEEEKAALEGRPARTSASPRSSTCRWTPTCRTTTCPRSPRSWSSTGAWAGWSPSGSSTRSVAELTDRYGPLPAARGAAAGRRAAALQRGGRGSRLARRARRASWCSASGPTGHARPRARALAPRDGRRPAAAAGGRPDVRLQPAARAPAGGRRDGLAAHPSTGGSPGRGRVRGRGRAPRSLQLSLDPHVLGYGEDEDGVTHEEQDGHGQHRQADSPPRKRVPMPAKNRTAAMMTAESTNRR